MRYLILFVLLTSWNLGFSQESIPITWEEHFRCQLYAKISTSNEKEFFKLEKKLLRKKKVTIIDIVQDSSLNNKKIILRSYSDSALAEKLGMWIFLNTTLIPFNDTCHCKERKFSILIDPETDTVLYPTSADYLKSEWESKYKLYRKDEK